MKKRGTLPCQWQDGGHGPSYTCLVVEDPSNKLRYVMHRFDVANWSEETVANVTKYYSTLVERNSSSPVWSSALRVLNSAKQSHYFNVVGELARLGTLSSFLSSCMLSNSNTRPRRVGSVAAGMSRWVTKLATSLAAMHELGVVHGDVRFTSLFVKNSDAGVVNGDSHPDIGDLDALVLGAPMPFAHNFITSQQQPQNNTSGERQRKPTTMPPPQEANTSESYAAIPPVHEFLLPLMKLNVYPPELNSGNHHQTKPSTSACDVYQFGALIVSLVMAFRFFLFAGNTNNSNGVKFQFQHCNTLENMIKIFAANTTNNRLRKLVLGMIHPDPTMRPSMQRVLKEIASISPPEIAEVFNENNTISLQNHNNNNNSNNNSNFLQQAPPPPSEQQRTLPPLQPEVIDQTNPVMMNDDPSSVANKSHSSAGNNSVGLGVVRHNDSQDSILTLRDSAKTNNNLNNVKQQQQQPPEQNNNNEDPNDQSQASIDSVSLKQQQQKVNTPTSANKNRRSIAEARLRQRQQQNQQQANANSGNNTPQDEALLNNNQNSNAAAARGSDDSAWLQSAEQRLQQLEEMKKEQDRASPTFLTRQQQQQREQEERERKEKEQQQQQQQRSPVKPSSFFAETKHMNNNNKADHLNETPPPQPSNFSPPKPQQQQQGYPNSYPSSGRGPMLHHQNQQDDMNNRESSRSPDPQKPAGWNHQHHHPPPGHQHPVASGGIKSPINNNRFQHAHHFNTNNKRPATAGTGGGGGSHLHELRNLKKHERNALLEKQEREQEEKRQAFLEMKAEKQRKQEEDRKAFLERQRAHAAHMKQIKQGKRGTLEAVLANQEHQQQQNNDNDHQNQNNNNNNNNHETDGTEVLQTQDDVQIFVKRSGVVMRCDDGTGFVPMTEEEKNNSPILANRRNKTTSASEQPQQQQNKQFHPQAYQRSALEDEEGDSTNKNNLVDSVKMQSQNNNNNLMSTNTTTDDGYTTGDQNKLNDEIEEGSSKENTIRNNNLASPSAMSTVQMSQKPGMAGRDRGTSNNVSNDEDVVILVPKKRDTNSPNPLPPVEDRTHSHHHQELQPQQQQQPSSPSVHPNLQHKHNDTLTALKSLLGEEAVKPMLVEVEVFAKAPPHVRSHPRANAVFATRIRNIVESQFVPKLTHAFGVATEEEGFMALLVMLGQVLMAKSFGNNHQPSSSPNSAGAGYHQHQNQPHQIQRTLSEEFEL